MSLTIIRCSREEREEKNIGILDLRQFTGDIGYDEMRERCAI